MSRKTKDAEFDWFMRALGEAVASMAATLQRRR